MQLIIAGTRDFNDYALLKRRLTYFLQNAIVRQTEIEIVSGGCQGADALGERYTQENNFKLKLFPADWAKYGKAAGPIRNADMARYASHCIVLILVRFRVKIIKFLSRIFYTFVGFNRLNFRI